MSYIEEFLESCGGFTQNLNTRNINKISYLMKYVKEGMIAVDIGACEGNYTKILSKLVGPTGEVFAYEPVESNFRTLVKNVGDIENVRLSRIAISDGIYEKEMFLGPHPEWHSLNIDMGFGTEKVHTDKLDNLIKVVDVIKIDVEGEEIRVLNGAVELLDRNNHMMILMEVHSIRFGISKKDMFDFLNSRWFDIYAISEKIYRINNYEEMDEEVVAIR